MNSQIYVDGIVRARHSAAKTLLEALQCSGGGFSEASLANLWMSFIERTPDILPFGWYQPPPRGVSVMVGNAPDFKRLSFKSLRSEENWPDERHQYTRESVLYPYFSAVDRATSMIGDHVGTYYSGSNERIRSWIKLCFKCTREIAEGTQTGMTFADLFALGNVKLRTLGARNGNYNTSSGLASDIGHTIPYFSELATGIIDPHALNSDQAALSTGIASAREFISAANQRVIQAPCAFTIEPQIISEDFPKVGFHLIVVFSSRGKLIVEAYDDLFRHFGMSDWAYE
jgi:hypothetical protein